ncbi:MAG: UDP-N-acetylglucosamine 2-epimerase (hydrolyzing) [Planctomycetaceae bacterium]|nr:UDP-N-acetylglucosamine 2-epimerase (hydrolyzing) [Planctomycetaceae bacterium]
MTPDASRPRTLAIVSSSRADMAHLIHPLRALTDSPLIDPVVMATAAVLQPEYGDSARRFHEEGFRVHPVPCDLRIETGFDAAQAIGRATIAFADAFDALRPDLVMVVADRFEMLAPANAALAMRIPIVHVEGGERSEGAIDDAVRNALTKLSHLHLVTTREAERRVLAMGEEAWRVHRVGAASLDHLLADQIPDAEALSSRLGFDRELPMILAAIHPVTLADDPGHDAAQLLEALERVPDETNTIIFAFPNADEGSLEIRSAVSKFITKRRNSFMHTTLPPETWLGLLHRCELVVGNSSSVLMESPSIPTPAVCIGERQAGRERARNVVDVAADADSILLAFERARSLDMNEITNPYGDGHASERIRRVLEEAPERERLLHKSTTLVEGPGA